MMEEGFVKAQSDNLAILYSLMITEFIENNDYLTVGEDPLS